MAKRIGQKIKLASVDELLGVPSLEGCQDIEVAKIHPFENHPFKVLDDDKMHELVESIMMNGVLTPVINSFRLRQESTGCKIILH